MRKSFSRLLLLLALITLTSVTPPGETRSSKGIDFFEGTWAEVKAESRETGKPIFVDAYAVWCGPCKWMSSNVFTDPDVAEYYNRHFINYKFDMEKGEGPGFARTYYVMAYPTLLYLDANGTVLKKVVGALGPEAFISAGQSVISSN